jgi:hypothetical protein
LSCGARELRKELERVSEDVPIWKHNSIAELKENTNAVGRLKKSKKIDNGFESWVFLQGKINFLLIFSLLFGSVFNMVVAGTVSLVLLVLLAFSTRKKV